MTSMSISTTVTKSAKALEPINDPELTWEYNDVIKNLNHASSNTLRIKDTTGVNTR